MDSFVTLNYAKTTLHRGVFSVLFKTLNPSWKFLGKCYNIFLKLPLKDEKCDVAFMPGQTCYRVNCFNESQCESVPAKPSNLAGGEVRISHIIRGGGAGDDVDEFRKRNGVNRNSSEYFVFSLSNENIKKQLSS